MTAEAAGSASALLTASERTASRRTAPGAVLAILVVALWLSRMILPGELPTSLLDDSWAQGLGHALARGLRAGVDYVFTFGPLGYFSTSAYVPEIFWAKLVLWEGLFGLLLAVVLAMAGAGIEHRLLRALWFAVAILSPLDPDAQAFLPIAAALAWIARGRPARRWAVPVAAVVFAVLSLVKFTFAVAALVAVAAGAIALLLEGSKRLAATLVLGWLGLLAAGWLALGQSLADVPTYVRRSIEISKGYAEAMSLPPPPVALPLSIALLLLASIAAWIHARSRAHIVGSLGQVALLLLVWKAGFVRAVDHTSMFFLFVAAAPLAYDAAVGAGRAALGVSFAARLACTAFAAGLLWAGGTPTTRIVREHRDPVQRTARHAGALLRPFAFRDRASTLLPNGAELCDLPRTREVVGKDTIDMVTNQQLLLFRNELSWTPRPVFQSYATFSPELAELNARFFEGPSAPAYVLFHLRSIDRRLPTMDDAAALPVLARDYEPVLAEFGRLLLRRNPRGSARGPLEIVRSGSVGFGGAIELGSLPGRCHLLRLDLRTTTAGRIANAIDSTPEIDVEIEADDGERLRFRIVPDMMRTGVLVDPILWTQSDWIDWCTGKRLRRPMRWRLIAPERAWAFEPEIPFEIARADDVAPRPRPDLAADLAYSLFRTRPSLVRSSVEPSQRMLFGHEVLAFSADSELVYEVEPGKHRMRGFFGANADPDSKPGGALVFSAVRSTEGSPDAVLFKRRVDPRSTPSDRRLYSFDSTLEFPAPAKIRLSARPEPGAEGSLACWSGVAVE